MKKKINLDWFYAAFIRAIRTMAQTALGMFTVGAAISEVAWTYIASVAVVAGVYSMLTSLATNLPETGTDGELLIDMTNSNDRDIYRLDLGSQLESLDKKRVVRLKVDPKADLSRK